jgi:hypothetical protein
MCANDAAPCWTAMSSKIARADNIGPQIADDADDVALLAGVLVAQRFTNLVAVPEPVVTQGLGKVGLVRSQRRPL